MSAKITLTLTDEGRTPVSVDPNHLIRYEPGSCGSVITCMTEEGLVTRVVRETRREIDRLLQDVSRLV
jgi:hypothetical protein